MRKGAKLLISYPINAAAENWLHEALVSILANLHHLLSSNSPIPAWEDLIPNNLLPDQKTQLISRAGIESRVFLYLQEIRKLSDVDRDEVLAALFGQNLFSGLADGTAPLTTLKPKFDLVHDAAKNLFTFAYETLTSLGVRDRQYKVIFDTLKNKICPFCGFERIMSPQEARQDLDHYFAKSIYPFAGVNLINLFPMCRCCNRDYKKDVDILLDSSGVRRKAFNPYQFPQVDLNLRKSIPFAGINKFPAWWIEFNPYSEEVQGWDETFLISIRYARDVLNNGLSRWLESFRKFCIKAKYGINLSDDEVLEILKNHYENTVIENPVGPDFLKPKVFDMLIHHFESDDLRTKKFVRDLITGVTP